MTQDGAAWIADRERKQAPRGWTDRALCRVEKIPASVFYTPNDTVNDTARAICERCPVSWECRQYAFETEEKHGIWGGVNFSDWQHPQNQVGEKRLYDPRVREAYRRVWKRNAPIDHGETTEVRKALRRLSDSELQILAALEGLI
jgi:hypothetical protein